LVVHVVVCVKCFGQEEAVSVLVFTDLGHEHAEFVADLLVVEFVAVAYHVLQLALEVDE